MSASVLSAARAGALLVCFCAPSLRAQSVAEVQVAPQTLTLGVGQKQTIFAAAFDRSGNLISNARFTFWTSDSSIARVQTDGTVTGVKPGLAKIEARTQGRRASLAVLVGDAAPSRRPRNGAVTGVTQVLQYASAVALDKVNTSN